MEAKEEMIAGLEQRSRKIRCHIVEMFNAAGHGHFGGSLSCTDIVTTLYFGDIMRMDAANPKWTDRDRLIVSKGHGAPAAYGALVEKGFIPEKWVKEYETLGANLSTHPNMHTIPGIDISAGSLGHGLSIGAGMALAAKMDSKDYHVYVILGDGELAEGAIWEAAMASAKYKLGNLTAIVDRNFLCVGGSTEDVMPVEPLADKWQAFGWKVIAIDGHDFKQIHAALTESKAGSTQPTVIIANTTKGCGVSFMANKREWHGHPISEEEYRQALAELRGDCKCTE